MRSSPTDAERRLWQILRGRRLADHKFKRQVPIDHYVVDFVCLARRPIIEADGGQHGEEADANRSAYLERQGFRILRFWNSDSLGNEDGVTESILAALAAPLPNP